MHRSVLQNKGYLKFSKANAVEVVSMEELGRALKEKAATVKTYKTKDAYDDEVEYLVEFPGLTLDDLKRLSDTEEILAFMEGGKIPYTAIVNPHTGKAMHAMKGKPTVKSLTKAIKAARKQLEKEHGKGVDRKLWRELGRVEVEFDKALAAKDLKKADALVAGISKKFKRPQPAVQTRLTAMAEALKDERKPATTPK